MGDVIPFKKKEEPPKPKLPEHIQRFYDLSKKVEGALKTTEHHHRKAHLAGEETIKDKNGTIDYDLLKQGDYQEKFANAMSDTYFDAAKKYFKIGKDAKGDAVWNEQLIHAYTGTTKAQMLDAIRNEKDNFSYDTFFKEYQSKFMSQLQNTLAPIPGSHLKKEHVADILKHAGLDKIVDGEKIGVNEVSALLGVYRKEKTIGKNVLQRVVHDYALKDKTYRTDYVEKKAA